MRVLFVCFHNSARSQMARAFFEHATTAHAAVSAGLRPGNQIDPLVIEVMAEVGIDIRNRVPCALSPSIVGEADIVVRSVRPDPDEYDWPVGPRYVDWLLPLPADESAPTIEEVRRLTMCDSGREQLPHDCRARFVPVTLSYSVMRPGWQMFASIALPPQSRQPQNAHRPDEGARQCVPARQSTRSARRES